MEKSLHKLLIVLLFLLSHYVVSANEVTPDSKDMAGFFDSLIIPEMEKYHIPGLSLVIVKDSSILFSKGYGYADVKKMIPVSPEKTIFFTGSVSKLFTATSIMQLYEQGKLDLDKDINQYLHNFQIDQNFTRPVTIKNLLTHTGGFEERNIGMAVLSREEMLSLEEFIALGNQPRVLPTGRYISYSNYGYTLLGYIVENVSGIPYPEYVEKYILSPLNMTNSSSGYRENLLPELAAAWAYNKGEYTELPVVYLNVTPAGSLMCTAEDISNFMIAHLNQGNFRGNRILQPETADLMHSRLFEVHPLQPGFCHGFYERFVNDERIIEHAGDINGYSSLLSLAPERDIGLYMVYNGGDRIIIGFREKVIEQFIKHYFPGEKQQGYLPGFDATKVDLNRFTGSYRMNRYARLSPEKLMSIVMEVQLKTNEENSLTLEFMKVLGIPTSNWKQVDSLLFFNSEEGSYMSFEEEKGRINHMNMSMGPPSNFEKMPWYAKGRLHLVLLIAFFLVFLMIVPGWGLMGLIRRIRKKEVQRSIPDRDTRRFAILVSFLNLLFLIGLPTAMMVAGQKLAVSVPWFIKMFPVIPIFSILFWLMLIYSGTKNREGRWKLSGRIQYLALIVCSFVFYCFLNYWNLLGFHFH